MEEVKLAIKYLANGQTLVYATEPGVVLQDLTTQPYGSTGVVDMAWMKATRIVGRKYTDREIKNGWPREIEPHRLACLQHPEGGNDQSNINAMLLAACERGGLQCRAFIRDDYALLRDGSRELIETWTDYSLTAPVFAAWLAAQGLEPSTHIAAWFKALRVNAQAAPALATNTAPPAPVADSASNAPDPNKGTPPKLTETDKAEVVRLYDRGRGVSVNKLAKQFGVSNPTIDKVLKREGVKN